MPANVLDFPSQRYFFRVRLERTSVLEIMKHNPEDFNIDDPRKMQSLGKLRYTLQTEMIVIGVMIFRHSGQTTYSLLEREKFQHADNIVFRSGLDLDIKNPLPHVELNLTNNGRTYFSKSSAHRDTLRMGVVIYAVSGFLISIVGIPTRKGKSWDNLAESDQKCDVSSYGKNVFCLRVKEISLYASQGLLLRVGSRPLDPHEQSQ